MKHLLGLGIGAIPFWLRFGSALAPDPFHREKIVVDSSTFEIQERSTWPKWHRFYRSPLTLQQLDRAATTTLEAESQTGIRMAAEPL